MRQLFALILATAAMPQGAMANDVQSRLAALHALILDPSARFSAREVLAQLDAVPTSPGSTDRGEVAHLRSIIERKIARPTDALKDADEALAIDAATPFLAARDRVFLVYASAKLRSDDKDCAGALPLYRRALALEQQEPSFSLDQRLGTQEQIGYCLHEVGRFADARDSNVAELAAGETLHGKDSPKLMTVLTNLAQNEYELGDKVAARGHLERVLAIATTSGDDAKVDDMLFQLGVLAFEDGRRQDATDLMTRRLARAKASGDPRRVEAAQGDLDELVRRLSR